MWYSAALKHRISVLCISPETHFVMLDFNTDGIFMPSLHIRMSQMLVDAITMRSADLDAWDLLAND